MRNGTSLWTSLPNASPCEWDRPHEAQTLQFHSSRDTGRVQPPTVTAAASFPSRTACRNARTGRRRGIHIRRRNGTFRNRGRDGQVLGRTSVGGKPRTSHEDPFGNIIRMTGTGTIARDNPFRFSTKRTDDTTDLVLYEYRAYSPSLGRWPSRDPIGERGGVNLYGFVQNDSVSGTDALGQDYGWPVVPPPGYPPTLPPEIPAVEIPPGIPATRYFWNAPSCDNGLQTDFIQVSLGTFDPRYWNPFVDDGTHGPTSSSADFLPFYPLGAGSYFEDSPGDSYPFPSPLMLGAEFIVCRVCYERCCGHSGSGMRSIVKYGPCVRYRAGWFGDADLGGPSYSRLEAPPSIFMDTLRKFYPNAASGNCFGSLGK